MSYEWGVYENKKSNIQKQQRYQENIVKNAVEISEQLKSLGAVNT